jgi:hypothetical protein
MILRRLIYVTLLGGLLLGSCAKQSSPTGGPTDEDAPQLLTTSPTDQSTSIRPEKIVLTFDEYVALDNPSKGIVITPKIQKELVEFSSLKNTVTILLKQALEDSTTYVFDFQKSVVDLSEKNPAENLKLVFSTGPTIDSLYLSGTVRFPFPVEKEDYKNVLVGIYPALDSTDVFTAPPYYIGQVDTLGNFKLNNLKAGAYRAYAWRDTNGNLKAEFKNEEYDFLPDTLYLGQEEEGLSFNLAKADLNPIKVLRSANFGKNFDVLLNRNAIETKVTGRGVGEDILYITGDKRIRFYPKSAQTDSLQLQLSLRDSVGFTKDSLIWAKFPVSERKPEKLDITANSGKSFYQQLQMELTFNKPITQIRFDSLYLAYDSASILPIRREMLSFADSSKRDLLRLRMAVPDSLDAEVFTLKAADSTFQDIEGLFNEKALAANYRKLKRNSLADGVSGLIEGANPPYVLQLISAKQEVAYELFINEGKAFAFKLLEPGTYFLRIIEDKNGNGIWDPSNYVQRKLAERVFYYLGEEDSRELVIRGGWTLEDLLIKANPPTGRRNFSTKPVDNP